MTRSRIHALSSFLLLSLTAAACGPPEEVASALDDTAAARAARLALTPAPTCPVGVSSEPLVVPTTRGLVLGKRADSTTAFLGIPYAMPPVGPLRFAPPVEHACWGGTRAATDFGPSCPQKNLLTGRVDGDEDCLTLNVWTPRLDRTAKLPVLVFLYGGGNVLGGTETTILSNLYDGRALADRARAVVVTPNYRIGALGFFAHSALDGESAARVSGNQGTLDQIAALKWVQANITAFGGDPTRVLIFGESAGAINTCTLLASPLAAGLFSRALMQSGACGAHSQAEQKATSQALATKLGCTSDVANCMRSLTADRLVGATESFSALIKDVTTVKPEGGLVGVLPWSSSVDGYVLKNYPLQVIAAGQHNKVPLVVGSNDNEGAIFAPSGIVLCAQYRSDVSAIFGANADRVLAKYPCEFWRPRQAEIDVITDIMFTCTARHTARAAATYAPVYRYFFTHGAAYGLEGPLGAYHSAELAYVFGTFGAKGYIPLPGEAQLSRNIQDYWGSHAATGSPATGALGWPGYALPGEQVLNLDTALSSSRDARPDKCDFWDSLYGPGPGG